MGGNAFKNVGRVLREQVPGTVQHVVNTLELEGFDFEYAMSHLMGSTGKKASSGDVDFAMNTVEPRFVGEPLRPVFNKHEVLNRVLEVLPESQVNSSTFRMGNLMTAWPVDGKASNGLVQVDFVFGKADWLLFTHFSPGEESRFKGVFLSQLFGVMAKTHKDWEKRDPETDERMARVGLHLGLEKGLFRRWEARRRPGMGTSECTPEFFETKFPEAPRFTRLGYVDDPHSVLEMLFYPGVKHEDLNTFEKSLVVVKEMLGDRYPDFVSRLLDSLTRSGAKHEYDFEQLKSDPVWLL